MSNYYLKMLEARLGGIPAKQIPDNYGSTTLGERLDQMGGTFQQNRMIMDKKRSLDKALLYSYQAATIQKEGEEPTRALINSDKLKPDYDDKILSVNWDYGMKTGDIFKWLNTDTYWIVYLLDIAELAYFYGNIRKCNYSIEWVDEGELKKSWAAITGPSDTSIDDTTKHEINIDSSNAVITMLLPANDDTIEYFKRYAKFYLQDDPLHTCWRVEATDLLSTPGIIEINAAEYYANETEDDIESGLVGVNITQPNLASKSAEIQGETFIKPKKEYTYTFTGSTTSTWTITDSNSVTISSELIQLTLSNKTASIRWLSTLSGEFVLHYGDLAKTIVVESLF